jgi:hypothetical protein
MKKKSKNLEKGLILNSPCTTLLPITLLPITDKKTNPNAPYSLKNNNCQDYCDALEKEFDRLKKQQSNKKKKP